MIGNFTLCCKAGLLACTLLLLSYHEATTKHSNPTLPTSAIVEDDCTEPLIQTIDQTPVFCPGEIVTLTVQGVLNDALNWHWYADDCGLTPLGIGSTYTFSPAQTTTLYVRGEPGCTGDLPCSSVEIVVPEDTTDPVLALPADLMVECGESLIPEVALCAPVVLAIGRLTVDLNSAGTITLAADQWDAGSYDPCANSNLTFSFAEGAIVNTKTFDCADLGVQTVSIWVSDSNGRQSVVETEILIQDQGDYCNNPSPVCLPDPILLGQLRLPLAADGQLNIEAEQFDRGSLDLCGSTGLTFSFSADPQDQSLNFGCGQLGVHNLQVWLTDDQNNQSYAEVTLTVEDPFGYCLTPGVCSPSLSSYHTLRTDLPPTRYLTLHAANLVKAAQDACLSGNLEEAVFVHSGLGYQTFSCADIGDHQLLIEVQDAAMQTIQVQVNLQIQDGQQDCLGVGFALGNDNCDPSPQVTFSDQIMSGACPGANVIKRTWTVTDASGNSVSGTQTITLEDATDPELFCLDNQTVSLDATCEFSLPDYTSQVTAGDACSVNLTIEQNPTPGTVIAADTEITITATDACNNSTSCSFWVLPLDETPPAMTCLEDQTMPVGTNCTIQVPDFTSQVLASDNCTGNLLLEQFPAPGTTISANTQVQIITEDEAGQTASCSFQIILTNAAPVLSATPADLTVACASEVPGDPGITALDDCDGQVPVTFSQTGLPLACSGSGQVVNTWWATDSQGQTVSHSQTVTIENTQAPTFSALPADLTVSCLADAPGNPGLTATSACGEPLSVFFQANGTPACPGIGQIIYTWIAQDCAGNSASHTQTITILDQTPPTLSSTPPNLTVSCVDDVPGAQGITATDNCGETLNVEYVQSALPTCPGQGTVTNTWTVSDCAGNLTTHSQTITIDDDQAPVLSNEPAAITVDCVADIPGSQGITATDNCGESLWVQFSQSSLPNCPGQGMVTNTWTATDCAGNTSTHTQTVTIADQQGPAFSSLPADLTVECVDEVPGNPGLSATDNCGEAIGVVFNQSSLPTCPGQGVVTNTWTATDCAGNTSTHVQSITIADTEGPLLSAYPANVVVTCLGEVPGDPGLSATDNCGETIEVVFSQSSLPTCPGQGVVTNTWTATDCAGNVTIHSQTVSIIDNEAPVLSGQPANLTVSCLAAIPGNPGLTATDNCDQSLTVVFSQSAYPPCPGQGTVTNTWSVTDCAGNNTTYQQVVTIDDNTAPVLSALPANLTVSCVEDVPGDQGITATDNCGGFVEVLFNQSGFPINYPNPNPIVNSWQVTDCAGNTTTHSQVVTLVDDELPIAVCEDLDITLAANGTATITPGMLDAGSTDNCGMVLLNISQNLFDCSHVGSNTVTLFVSDLFGNTVSCEANVQVTASPVCTPPAIAYAGGPTIADPCTCQGAGVFDEEVVVGPTGPGQNWMVQNTSLLDPNTQMPFLPGTPLTEEDLGNGQVLYTLVGAHLDGNGYTIAVTSPSFPNEVLQISNTCYYPQPAIIGLDGPFCLLSDPVALEGSAQGVALVDSSFTINGLPATEFDPSELGVGTHTVTYTVDAGQALPNDPSDPGCEASVSEQVQILATPAILACNGSLSVAVDQNCEVLVTPDLILEGNYLCYDDYSVTVKKGFNTIPNPVTGDYLGDNLTVTVTHLITGNSCGGTLTIFDALAPSFDCPTEAVAIACTENIDDVPPPPATDNCTDVEYLLVDQLVVDEDACDDGKVRIARVWKAVDEYNNESATCTQLIDVLRPDDVDFPNDIAWECDQYSTYTGLLNPTPLHPAVKALEVGTAVIDATNINTPSILAATGAGIPLDLDGQYCNYSYSHADQIVGACGSTFEIVRTWIVLDWCTNTVITTNQQGEDNIQLVKVVDVTAPQVGLGPYTVSANVPGSGSNFCTSQELLTPPAVSDNCNDWTIRIFSPIGEALYVNGVDGAQGGYIPAPGLGVGTHQIIYQVEDECGNLTEIIVPVTVVDDIAPVAICDQITEINLSSDGLAVVNASVFDDGSIDNCCIDYFVVRRLDDPCNISGNTSFSEYVTFCCEDINDTIPVEFRVYDCYGNYNICEVDVIIADKLDPVLATCPGPITIDCGVYQNELAASLSFGDYAVLDIFGTPTFFDNCEVLVSQNVVEALNTCTEGTITRTWTATDSSGNGPVTCTQVITVKHSSDFVVSFPDDIEATCVNGTLPDFGEPEIFFDNCELVGIAFDDMTFYIVPDACFKVVRTWSVINWCLFDEYGFDAYAELSEYEALEDFDNDGDIDQQTFRDGTNDGPEADGYIQYDQILKVIDTEAPVFVVQDQEVCILNTGCNTDVVLPMPTVVDCSDQVTVTITTNLPNGNSFGPYEDVPVGVYTATYAVTDHCGNIAYDAITIEVSDCKLPTPVCNSFFVEIMQTGMIDIVASSFNAGSYDNCPGALTYSFSSNVADSVLTLTCDMVGPNFVDIWVTDASGNQDFCQTYVFLQDNMGVCDPIVSIAGSVMTETSQPVVDARIEINGGQFSYMTDQYGEYVSDPLPLGGDYTIKSIKDTLLTNGVTTLDKVLAQKHILGIQLLDSPYKIIAADVNNSGQVTTLDLVYMQKVILLLLPEFPNNTSWRFVPMEYEFQDPLNPLNEPFPEVMNYNNLNNPMLDVDFIALKVGDVNNTANPALAQSVDDRSFTGTVRLGLQDRYLLVGERVQVPVYVDATTLIGMQFTLQIDPTLATMTNCLEGVILSENMNQTRKELGQLLVSYSEPYGKTFAAGEILLTLELEARQEGWLSEWIKVSADPLRAEAYTTMIEFHEIELQFNQQPGGTDPFVLYQNLPNPFFRETMIGFDLPQADRVQLRVLDLQGQMVWEESRSLSEGYHQWVLEGLQEAGVYYYQIQTSTHLETRKMIKQD